MTVDKDFINAVSLALWMITEKDHALYIAVKSACKKYNVSPRKPVMEAVRKQLPYGLLESRQREYKQSKSAELRAVYIDRSNQKKHMQDL